MRYWAIIPILLILSFHTALSRTPELTKIDAFLHNWAAAQTGMLLGVIAAAGSFRLLETTHSISFNSEHHRLEAFYISAGIAGNVTGNYFLKRKTGQSFKAFSANMLFSTLPLMVHAIFVKPRFYESIEDEFKVFLTSLIGTPIFSAIGYQIFKDVPLLSNRNEKLSIQTGFYAMQHRWIFGVRFNF